MTVAAGSTGSATLNRRIALEVNRTAMGVLWFCCLVPFLLFSPGFVLAADIGFWRLVGVVVITLPLLLVPGLFLVGATRLVFGQGPVMIVDETAVIVPRLGLSIDKSEVRFIHDGGLFWAKRSGVTIRLTHARHPPAEGRPSALRISPRSLASGVAENRDRLPEALRSPGVGRTEERASIRSDAISVASGVDAR